MPLFVKLLVWLGGTTAAMLVPIAGGMAWTESIAHGLHLGIWIAGGSLFVAALLRRIGGRLRPLPEGQLRALVLVFISFGIVLRAGWLTLVPAIQVSDFAEYWETAVRLVESGRYYTVRNGYEFVAFRPPGYPALLAALIWVFGPRELLPALVNLLAFAGTAWLTYDIGRGFDQRVGLLALASIVLWPGYVMYTGLASSDTAALFLLTLIAWLLLRRGPQRPLQWGLCLGVATGWAALTRPAFLVLPVVYFVACFLGDARAQRARMALAAVVMTIVVVSPWTVRNYRMLGGILLVSSNEGKNLYRANNPLATGGWSKRGERDETHLLTNELEWHRTTKSWAVEWIAAHPMAFSKLAIQRACYFLGTDDTGAYWTLERGHRLVDARAWTAKLVSDAWWFVFWAAILSLLLVERRAFQADWRCSTLLLLALFLLPVHLVYESHPRYHVPTYAVVAILASLWFARWPNAHFR